MILPKKKCLTILVLSLSDCRGDAQKLRGTKQIKHSCNIRHLESSSGKLAIHPWPNSGESETKIHVIKSYCNSRWDAFFEKSVDEWNRSPAIQLKKYAWRNGKCAKRQYYYENAINVIDGHWPRYKWEGMSSKIYTVVGGKRQIVSVLIAMNNYYLMGKKKESYDDNRQQTMCHELGHALGLNHPNENHWNENTGSCMDYSAVPEGGVKYGFDFGPPNTTPNSKDFQTLAKVYFHKGRLLEHDDGVQTRSNYTNELGGLDFDIVRNVDLDDFGRLLSESSCNGFVERAYEKVDDNYGLIISTYFLGAEDGPS